MKESGPEQNRYPSTMARIGNPNEVAKAACFQPLMIAVMSQELNYMWTMVEDKFEGTVNTKSLVTSCLENLAYSSRTEEKT